MIRCPVVRPACVLVRRLSLSCLVILCFAGNACSVDLEVRQLPDSVGQQTRFLNTDYLVASPEHRQTEAQLPLLIFLHGAGGRGDDIERVKRSAASALAGMEKFGGEPSLFVVPQALKGTREIAASWLPKDLDRFLEHLKATYPIDPSRIYLTGNSMGGYGSWAWAAQSPDQFAAVAPVVGGLGQGGPKDITPDLDRWAENLAKIPVWAFHGAKDNVVPADRSERMVKLIRDKGGERARLTIYPDEGHGASRRVYTSREFFEWMFAQTTEANGLAPEVSDLNADDVSYALEAELPDLQHPFIDPTPSNRHDGIAVGELGADGGNKDSILEFAAEIAAGDHGDVDSLLLYHDGRLLLESYYRRGRINYPHYQMSITKSYTAMAIGRAIQLGLLTMAELDEPVVSFLSKVDQTRLVAGASSITLAEAMNMRSGIRLNPETVTELRKASDVLKGQGQVQAYLQHSAPIAKPPREFKYQGSDPSLTMQVLEAVVQKSTGIESARAFIASELLGKIRITNYAWQDDVSGYPKSAAGSSICSRDMIKWGMLILNEGNWNGEQLIPAEFIQRATSRIHTNPQGTSYGYFWWRTQHGCRW